MKEKSPSWDSYMDTLLAILSHFQPQRVLEFGSGKSTGVLAMAPSVKELYTIEHSQEYFSSFNKAAFDNLEMRLITDANEYPKSFNRTKLYDLIFVDGLQRTRCMREVKPYLSYSGILMLHDAGRVEYEEGIRLYKYPMFTDGGHTVCLTDEVHVYEALQPLLNNLKNKIGVKT